MISRETVEDIISAVRIEEVVGDFISLRRRGVNLLGLCPFHNEKTPSFTVSPAKGNGVTHLARQALKEYLKDNPELAKELTAEHKIYIEDYLRKKVQTNKQVTVGMSMEFQKSLIQEAIAKSKTLNENQLKNLHKYAVRVPSLS